MTEQDLSGPDLSAYDHGIQEAIRDVLAVHQEIVRAGQDVERLLAQRREQVLGLRQAGLIGPELAELFGVTQAAIGNWTSSRARGTRWPRGRKLESWPPGADGLAGEATRTHELIQVRSAELEGLRLVRRAGIARLRERGLSGYQLAPIFGVSQTTISNWTHGT